MMRINNKDESLHFVDTTIGEDENTLEKAYTKPQQAQRVGQEVSQSEGTIVAKPAPGVISAERVRQYVQDTYREADSTDRIEDRGFAYYINTQPREHIDTDDFSAMAVGNGPLVIVKDTGEVFSFSSNPVHMFGISSNGIGVNNATTYEEFQYALCELKSTNDYSALNPEIMTLR